MFRFEDWFDLLYWASFLLLIVRDITIDPVKIFSLFSDEILIQVMFMVGYLIKPRPGLRATLRSTIYSSELKIYNIFSSIMFKL